MLSVGQNRATLTLYLTATTNQTSNSPLRHRYFDLPLPDDTEVFHETDLGEAPSTTCLGVQIQSLQCQAGPVSAHPPGSGVLVGKGAAMRPQPSYGFSHPNEATLRGSPAPSETHH